MTETNITALPVPSFAAGFKSAASLGDPSSMLLYGRGGTRKTSMLGSLLRTPGFDKLLILDIDSGTNVFANDKEVHSWIRQDGIGAPGEKTINIVPIDKRDPSAFAYLRSFLEEATSQDFGYDAIAVDSLDVAQDVAVEWFLANTYNDDGSKLNPLAAWGEVSKWTTNLFWDFQNKPWFTGIIIGHADSDVDKKTGQATIKPKLSGSAKNNVDSIPDIVTYLWEDEVDGHNAVIGSFGAGGGDFITKSRYSTLLPTRMVNPTFPEIYAYIRGQKQLVNNTEAATAA